MLGGTYGRRVTVVAGQGQQRRRRASRGAAACAARGRRCRRAARSRTAFGDAELRRALARADLVIDAMYGTGFRGRARRRGRERSRCAERVDRARCSRSTSRRASTARPEWSPARRCARRRRSASRRYKPGCCSSRAARFAGRVRVIDIGIEVDGRSQLAVLDVADLALPTRRGTSRTSGRRDVSWWAGRAAWSVRRCSRGAPRSAAAPGWWCARSPVPAPPRRSPVASSWPRALPATPDGALDEDARGRGAEGARAVPRAGDRSRSRPRSTARRRRSAGSSPRPTLPMVIDADALERDRGRSVGVRARATPPDCRSRSLTPHAGEYERLAGRASRR